MDALTKLNSLAAADAKAELLKCCGSTRWAERMVEDRPFSSIEQLTETAKQVWWSLDPTDWLEAFHSHPKIGETKAAAATSTEAQHWSADEQSGMKDSAGETKHALAELNRRYEAKFGFIFIICAAGKSSEEILDNLRQRLGNQVDQELRIAAAEQEKITSLRLQKLMQTLA